MTSMIPEPGLTCSPLERMRAASAAAGASLGAAVTLTIRSVASYALDARGGRIPNYVDTPWPGSASSKPTSDVTERLSDRLQGRAPWKLVFAADDAGLLPPLDLSDLVILPDGTQLEVVAIQRTFGDLELSRVVYGAELTPEAD